MNEVLDEIGIFNCNFEEEYPVERISANNYINGLIHYWRKTEFVDENVIKNLSNLIQSIIISKIIEDKNLDPKVDFINFNELYNLYSNKYVRSINRFLISLNNPYEASLLLLNAKVLDILDEQKKVDEENQRRLLDKISYLKELTANLMEIDEFYKKTIRTLENIIKEYDLSNIDFISDYTPLQYIGFNSDSDVIHFEKYIDKLIEEAKIIRKFDQKDVDRLLRKLFNNDKKQMIKGILMDEEELIDEDLELDQPYFSLTQSNLCKVILSNYILSNYYVDSADLTMSDFNYNALINNMQMISIEDIEDILSEGPIDFSEEETKYILKNGFSDQRELSEAFTMLIKNKK